MGTTQPIRKKEDILRLKQYFWEREEYRNYAMIVVGLNLPIRISDLLSLKWSHVYNLRYRTFYEHIVICEQKTKKMNCLALNRSCQDALILLKRHTNLTDENQFCLSNHKQCRKESWNGEYQLPFFKKNFRISRLERRH